MCKKIKNKKEMNKRKERMKENLYTKTRKRKLSEIGKLFS